MLNLARSATRGEKSLDDRQMIRVPARLLECRMTLPFGSSDGLYDVQIQRTVQNEVLKTGQGNAAITDGDVRLDIELDLSNMAAGRYLLSYRHAGESWTPYQLRLWTPQIKRPLQNGSVRGSTWASSFRAPSLRACFQDKHRQLRGTSYPRNLSPLSTFKFRSGNCFGRYHPRSSCTLDFLNPYNERAHAVI